MLAALTSINPATGALTRYEVGGQLRKTHHCAPNPDAWFDGESLFDLDMLDKFKRGLLGQFYCGPLIAVPGGTDPPATPGAARAPEPLAA